MDVISTPPAVCLLGKLKLSMTDDLNAAHIQEITTANELTVMLRE